MGAATGCAHAMSLPAQRKAWEGSQRACTHSWEWWCKCEATWWLRFSQPSVRAYDPEGPSPPLGCRHWPRRAQPRHGHSPGGLWPVSPCWWPRQEPRWGSKGCGGDGGHCGIRRQCQRRGQAAGHGHPEAPPDQRLDGPRERARTRQPHASQCARGSACTAQAWLTPHFDMRAL